MKPKHQPDISRTTAKGATRCTCGGFIKWFTTPETNRVYGKFGHGCAALGRPTQSFKHC